MGNKTGSIDVSAATAACLAETARLVRKHGPRLAGTTACADAAEDIARQARVFADSVRVESFRINPGSFYAYTKILPISYLIGMVALFAFGSIGPFAIVGQAIIGLAIVGLAAGVARAGFAKLSLATFELEQAVRGADVIMVATQALAHERVARELALRAPPTVRVFYCFLYK
jgi:hypothetical protein